MRIYLDVTETEINKLRTGIQRVVREVVSHADHAASRLGVEVVPVVAKGRNFFALENLDVELLCAPDVNKPAETQQVLPSSKNHLIKLIKRLLCLIPFAYSLAVRLVLFVQGRRVRGRASMQEAICVEKGDVLLLLDSFWCTEAALRAAAKFRQRGGSVYMLVYDVIPITHPHFYDRNLVLAFKKAFAKALRLSSGAISISRSVSDDVRRLVNKGVLELPQNFSLDYFHLGSDFLEPSPRQILPIEWPEGLWNGEVPVFLMVGTIEPRKGHAFVFDAFERRWADGKQEKLLIIGKVGWKTEALVKRMQASPYYGKRLYMLNGVTDAALEDAYKRAYACVMASETEGFGLPLIEAMQKGIPVVASDIPVFREIGGEFTNYFTLGDIGSFNDVLNQLNKNYGTMYGRLKEFDWLNWKQATEQLLSKLVHMNSR